MLSNLDLIFFCCFFLFVVLFAICRKPEKSSREGYFLAGRSLTWPMIGISIVACNLSTEQLVGMAGQAAGKIGLAVSAWQLVGSVGLVLIAFTILPRFLRSGIYTLPEYLEYRYCPAARRIMAVAVLASFVFVSLTSVLFSGGITISTIFEMDLTDSIWTLGLIGLVYSSWGGMGAVTRADFVQGIVLLIGGALVFGLGISRCGGWSNFVAANGDKLHMVLPATNPNLPWTGVLSGMWIAIVYYCGLNQLIMQRSLAARNLHESQMGLVFASAIWLLVPFIIVMPGIIASQLYPQPLLENPDRAFPLLMKNLIPVGLRGFMLAAIAGAVVSTVSALLISGSTIFAIDLYQQIMPKSATHQRQVLAGKLSMVVFVCIACLIAPALAKPEFGGIYQFIQQSQGYIWPGVCAAYLMGWAMPKAPPAAGLLALLGGPVIYGMGQLFLRNQQGEPSVHFLIQVFLTFLITCTLMSFVTLFSPMPCPRVLPEVKPAEPHSRMALIGSALVISAVISFSVWFR